MWALLGRSTLDCAALSGPLAVCNHSARHMNWPLDTVFESIRIRIKGSRIVGDFNPDEGETVDTDILVIGGGPAGMALGLALSLHGVGVTVLESSATSTRSFRGESISPDSVFVLRSLGVFDQLPAGSHTTVDGLRIVDAGQSVLSLRFEELRSDSELPTEVPQDVLLDAMHASANPGKLRVIRAATVTELVRTAGRVSGVRYRREGVVHSIASRLVVAADGRYGTTASMASLPSRRKPMQRDFLWVKVTAPDSWDRTRYQVRMRADSHVMCIPTVPDLVRLGVNIPPGGLREIRASGLPALHDRIGRLVPELADTVAEQIGSWRDTSVLDIFTSYMPRWSTPGLVAIGDAAHTLSPVLAQGVNHAILDAVVLADLLPAALTHSTDIAIDDACRRFQDIREKSVEDARSLQMRQELAFAQRGYAAEIGRRSVYRAIGRSASLKRRIWGPIYYSLLNSDSSARHAVDRLAARRVDASVGV